jgi:hypothetical protein
VSRTYNSDRSACPSCKAMGRDSGNDHLRVFSDDPSRGWCYSENKVIHLDNEGGYLEHRGTKGKGNGGYARDGDSHQQYGSGLDLAAIGALPIRALIHKPIPLEIVEKFGVRVAVSEMDGVTIESVFYPYHDSEGNLTGYKKRRLPKEF